MRKETNRDKLECQQNKINHFIAPVCVLLLSRVLLYAAITEIYVKVMIYLFHHNKYLSVRNV